MNIPKAPAIVLAVALNGFVGVAGWLTGAVALFGNCHVEAAAAPAIIGVVPIDSAGAATGSLRTNANGRVGQTFRYAIVLTNAGVNPAQTYYSASPLPQGLTINTNLGGNGWITGTPTTIGVYSPVTLTAGNSDFGSDVTLDIRITVRANEDSRPVITVPPVSQALQAGADVLFTVTATGSGPLGYNWRFNGQVIPGASTSRLQLSNVQPTNSGTYSVSVTNSEGSASASATLAVDSGTAGPSIIAQPQSLTIGNGATAVFSVTASGTAPLSYQWLKESANLPDATNSTYRINSVTTTDAGHYSVVITNSFGAVTSSVATLAVLLPSVVGAYTLVGWSETGLHETDGSDVSVYALAPPYSTIHAQLISDGLLVTNSTGLTVTYEAIADASGSINTTSRGKGNFYQYAQSLYGVALAADQGLAGFGMPGSNNQPQTMTFDPAQNCFTAQGIPITPYDDQGHKNYFPMMHLVVRDNLNNILVATDIALPVTDEMDCRACHASGSQTAARPPSGWAWDTDPQRDYKLNVLRSHDDHFLGTVKYADVLSLVGYNQAGLVATVVRDGDPVLCIRCHSSGVLPNTGAPAMRPLTQLMHTKHAYVADPQTGSALTSLTNTSSCLLCHAGPENRLIRGVHRNTIGSDGSLAMQCQSCHGSISAVGTAGRQGWLDEPSCQSCHTGTALTNSGALSFTSAFDVSGQTRQPADLTYATETNTPAGLALFRSSHGHGGLNCAACHGPAHAEWLSAQPNENVQSRQLQNSSSGGVLTDCAACHPTRPTQRTGGPHGMHPVDAQWASNHEQNNRTQCEACHGTDSRGTALSLAQANRNYSASGVRLWQGFQVGCYNCHAGPGGGENGTSGNFAPTVANLSATAIAGTPAAITLAGSDPNGNPLTFRIVSQPANGTVSLSGNNATYFPDPAFVGTDSFTYAAWDGSTDSTLATVALTATPGQCLLSATVLAPTAAYPNSTVPFRAVAGLAQCSSALTYDWDFGDSSPHGSGTNVAHNYSLPADYHWTLKLSANGTSQTVSGVVTISPTLGPPVTLTLTASDWMVTVTWPVDSIPTALETAYDLTEPYAWQPDITDYIYSDGTNNIAQVFFLPGQQFFRVRRLP